MRTGNLLKNSLFLVLTGCKVPVTLFWGSKVPQNDLFFKKVFKIFENFFVKLAQNKLNGLKALQIYTIYLFVYKTKPIPLSSRSENPKAPQNRFYQNRSFFMKHKKCENKINRKMLLGVPKCDNKYKLFIITKNTTFAQF